MSGIHAVSLDCIKKSSTLQHKSLISVLIYIYTVKQNFHPAYTKKEHKSKTRTLTQK